MAMAVVRLSGRVSVNSGSVATELQASEVGYPT